MKKDYTPKKAAEKGPSFTLYDSEFHCASMVSAEVVIGFTKLISVSADEESGEPVNEIAGAFGDVLAALEELFRAAINIPEEYERWTEMRSSNQTIIPIGTLVEIGMDLTDYYSSDMSGEERPTTAPSGTGSNRQSRRGASKAGASRTAYQTYERSEPVTTGP